MFKTLLEDARSIADRDPAARSAGEVFLLYSGFHALIYYRMAHWLYGKRRFFLARWMSQLGRFFTGIEIHPGAQIGRGLFIDHGMGVVIGETAVVGDHCTIYHGVTLGGTGKDTGKRHPTVGDGVLIGAGAKLLGPFRVGDHARIAAGSVVLHEVPEGATVVGVPGRVARMGGRSAPADSLNQTDVPDISAQELCRLLRRVHELERRVDRLTAERAE